MVDDAQDNLDLVCACLELGGFRSDTASNGRMGVDRALAVTPDAILMDLSMPIMDGIEAEALLASDARTHRVPVLMLTAQPERIPASTRRRCAAVLAKPCQVDHLLDALKSALASSVRGSSGHGAQGPGPDETGTRWR